jgi:hypothetical protein
VKGLADAAGMFLGGMKELPCHRGEGLE